MGRNGGKGESRKRLKGGRTTITVDIRASLRKATQKMPAS